MGTMFCFRCNNLFDTSRTLSRPSYSSSNMHECLSSYCEVWYSCCTQTFQPETLNLIGTLVKDVSSLHVKSIQCRFFCGRLIKRILSIGDFLQRIAMSRLAGITCSWYPHDGRAQKQKLVNSHPYLNCFTGFVAAGKMGQLSGGWQACLALQVHPNENTVE